ncbi:hypothetical protein ACGFZP_10555 [Kitasatospora sp. NPDC048239]
MKRAAGRMDVLAWLAMRTVALTALTGALSALTTRSSRRGRWSW